MMGCPLRTHSPLLLFVVLLRAAAAGTSADGRAFLASHAEEPGVHTTASGLQYAVVASAAEDAPSPGPEDPCLCRYVGTLIDGTQFDAGAWGGIRHVEDSSRRGFVGTYTFRPVDVIAGWTEALLLMREGDAWDLAIPSELGYGDAGNGRGRGAIPGGAVLLFRLELVEVDPEPASLWGAVAGFKAQVTWTGVLGACVVVAFGALVAVALKFFRTRVPGRRRRGEYAAVELAEAA